jgi:hypothetical protein
MEKIFRFYYGLAEQQSVLCVDSKNNTKLFKYISVTLTNISDVYSYAPKTKQKNRLLGLG